jgi:hypothetical protein
MVVVLMVIDTSYFGFGVGLVLVGYICGIVQRVILKALATSENVR